MWDSKPVTIIMGASARWHRHGEWPLACFPQLGQHRDVGKGRGKKTLKGKRDHSAFGGAGVESFCIEWEGERLRMCLLHMWAGPNKYGHKCSKG